MKILSVRLSLTGIFKTTITFFSLTSKQSVDMLLTTCPRLLKVVCQYSICGERSFQIVGRCHFVKKNINKSDEMLSRTASDNFIDISQLLVGHIKSGHIVKKCVYFFVSPCRTEILSVNKLFRSGPPPHNPPVRPRICICF